MRPEKFARLIVENYIKNNSPPEFPDKLADIEVDRAGAFVSIKTHDGDLRGCIGTITATENSVIDEIKNNAIAAATRDPRFPAVDKTELNFLKYSVDILHEPEKIKDLSQLNPKIYGIIVLSESGKQALLLPDLEGLDTKEKQLSACMRKAGIPVSERIAVQRFKVDRYSE